LAGLVPTRRWRWVGGCLSWVRNRRGGVGFWILLVRWLSLGVGAVGRKGVSLCLGGWVKGRDGQTVEPPSVDILVGCLDWGWSFWDSFQQPKKFK
jgi:hypothetical protein